MNIAVCLASYNGATFIRAQLESILSELGSDDVVFISDDGSTDGTITEIERIGDPRIILFRNPKNLGYIRNFESAASRINADYIFFSDQDDLWVPGRVTEMITALCREKKNILFGTFDLIGDVPAPSVVANRIMRADSPLGNLVKLFLGRPQFPYYGSSMVLTAVAKSYVFPIPVSGISHDVWAALLGNLKNDVVHLQSVVTLRRLHGNNLTDPKRSLIAKISTRMRWIAGMAIFFFRSR